MSADAAPTPQPALSVDLISTEESPTLVCRGRITQESGSYFKAQVKNLSPQHAVLLVDMSGVDFVDSSGLGGILGAYISARSNGCELKLINVNPRIKDLLDLTKLSGVLQK
jgi:anti-sigma B factor antagonist